MVLTNFESRSNIYSVCIYGLFIYDLLVCSIVVIVSGWYSAYNLSGVVGIAKTVYAIAYA